MSKQFYQVGGSLPANAKSYIKREADEKLYSYLKEGKYAYILNARQVGKSSLRVHTSKRLEEEGYSCVNIDLTSIGSEDIRADEWYFSFVFQVIEQLGLEEDAFIEWWDLNDKLTIVNRFSKVFDKFILEKSQKNIIIMIDEVDSILGIKKDFSANDFFAVIRTFYNLRSEDERYSRVTFALFGVATPEDLMRDSSRTPFNIAHSVKIEQFKLEESLSLLDGLENQQIDSRVILEKIFEWTSGTPYLTQKILDYIVHNPIEQVEDIDKVVDILFIQENFKEINISNIQNRILSNEKYNLKMLYLIGEIMIEGSVVYANDKKIEQIYLKLSGLIKSDDGILVYTNKIYAVIFNQEWLEELLRKVDRPFAKDLQRWMSLNRVDSALLQGKVLEKAIEWAEEKDDLTSNENEYLRLSSELNQQLILKEEKRKSQSKLIQLLSISLLILLMSIYFYFKNEEAQREKELLRSKVEYSSNNIDSRLNSMEINKNEEVNSAYVIPKSIGERVEIEKALRVRFSVSDTLYREKSALIQLILHAQRINFDKRSWINVLNVSTSTQEERLFSLLQRDAYLNRADSYFYNKDEEKSIDLYKKVLKLDKKSKYVYVQLGEIYKKKKMYEESLSYYKEALKLDSKNAKLYYTIGTIYRKKQEYDKALEFYAEALKLNPKNYWVYIDIGNIYGDKKEYLKAIDSYKKAIEINPNRYWVYVDIGTAYTKLNRFKDAIEYYEQAININPAEYEAYNSIGYIYKEQKEYKKAIEAYEKVISLKPKNDKAYNQLASSYFELGQYVEAKKMYEEALKINPKSHINYYKMGMIYTKLGEKERAKAYFTKVLKANSKEYEDDLKKGIVLNELKRYKEAMKLFDKLIKEEGATDEIYYHYGNSFYRLHQYKRAIEQYEKAIELNPNNDTVYNDLGLTYAHLKKPRKAILYYKKALEINPEKYNTYNNLGVSYLAIKDRESAVGAFKSAIEANDLHNVSYMNLFKVRLWQGRFFDGDIKNRYINKFQNKKSYFIKYEMLEILNNIAHGANVNLDSWKNKYRDTPIKWGSFSEQYAWLKTIKNRRTKANLRKALNVFYNHDKKI